MLWLDHKIFGNGFGMKTPHCDGVFYCLGGELYTFSAGFGAQLFSRQWFHPLAGERRKLAGREFVVFRSTRRWLRVEVAWALVDLPRGINEANEALRDFKSALSKL